MANDANTLIRSTEKSLFSGRGNKASNIFVPSGFTVTQNVGIEPLFQMRYSIYKVIIQVARGQKVTIYMCCPCLKVYIDRVKAYQVHQNYLNWPKRHLKLVDYSIHIHLNQW